MLLRSFRVSCQCTAFATRSILFSKVRAQDAGGALARILGGCVSLQHGRREQQALRLSLFFFVTNCFGSTDSLPMLVVTDILLRNQKCVSFWSRNPSPNRIARFSFAVAAAAERNRNRSLFIAVRRSLSLSLFFLFKRPTHRTANDVQSDVFVIYPSYRASSAVVAFSPSGGLRFCFSFTGTMLFLGRNIGDAQNFFSFYTTKKNSTSAEQKVRCTSAASAKEDSGKTKESSGRMHSALPIGAFRSVTNYTTTVG